MMERGQSVRNRGWLKLAAVVVVISLIWLVALPQISRLDRGIEPAAFFYDEHPASLRWEQEINAATEKDPAAFGLPGRNP